jgi:hypothetical protein
MPRGESSKIIASRLLESAVYIKEVGNDTCSDIGYFYIDEV